MKIRELFARIDRQDSLITLSMAAIYVLWRYIPSIEFLFIAAFDIWPVYVLLHYLILRTSRPLLSSTNLFWISHVTGALFLCPALTFAAVEYPGYQAFAYIGIGALIVSSILLFFPSVQDNVKSSVNQIFMRTGVLIGISLVTFF